MDEGLERRGKVRPRSVDDVEMAHPTGNARGGRGGARGEPSETSENGREITVKRARHGSPAGVVCRAPALQVRGPAEEAPSEHEADADAASPHPQTDFCIGAAPARPSDGARSLAERCAEGIVRGGIDATPSSGGTQGGSVPRLADQFNGELLGGSQVVRVIDGDSANRHSQSHQYGKHDRRGSSSVHSRAPGMVSSGEGVSR